MKPPVGRNSTITFEFGNIFLEVVPIPVASEIAIIHHNRSSRIDNMCNLADRMNRAKLMWGNTYDAACGAKLPKEFLHSVGVVG